MFRRWDLVCGVTNNCGIYLLTAVYSVIIGNVCNVEVAEIKYCACIIVYVCGACADQFKQSTSELSCRRPTSQAEHDVYWLLLYLYFTSSAFKKLAVSLRQYASTFCTTCVAFLQRWGDNPNLRELALLFAWQLRFVCISNAHLCLLVSCYCAFSSFFVFFLCTPLQLHCACDIIVRKM